MPTRGHRRVVRELSASERVAYAVMDPFADLDYEAAFAALDPLLEEAEATGDRVLYAHVVARLADTFQRDMEPSIALQVAGEALEALRDVRADDKHVLMVEHVRARALVVLDDPRAEQALRSVIDGYDHIGFWDCAAEAREQLADLLTESDPACQEALDLLLAAIPHTDHDLVSGPVQAAVAIVRAQGDVEGVIELLQQGCDLVTEIEPGDLVFMAPRLAQALDDTGRSARATRVLQAARQRLAELDCRDVSILDEIIARRTPV